MDYKLDFKEPIHQSTPLKPRLIIHGGAGNLQPSTLSPTRYRAYHTSLLHILSSAHRFLNSSSSFPLATAPYVSALDAVTYAVTLLENNPLFNAGHGAVFTRDGINELEASIMVSSGKKKSGVGVMGLRHVKNPIKLAREMLLRGEEDLEAGSQSGIGAQGHSQLHKYSGEKLAREWGLEMVEPKYFFVQQRWDEHLAGLEREKRGMGTATWSEKTFVSQGTCGAVAMDASGVIATATSTGGMTNKLTGRIGDTPTLGAGFWAEHWETEIARPEKPLLVLSETLKGLMADCFPSLSYDLLPRSDPTQKSDKSIRALGVSGTGNGDSFLRINAARTVAAIARYSSSQEGTVTLQDALTEVAGPNGDLQKSAGERWGRTGEGEGGIIGIEVETITDAYGNKKRTTTHVANAFNCGGLLRAWVNDQGKAVMRVWKEGEHEGMGYEGEGKEYDLEDWIDEKYLDPEPEVEAIEYVMQEGG
jgi:L-asparaginase